MIASIEVILYNILDNFAGDKYEATICLTAEELGCFKFYTQIIRKKIQAKADNTQRVFLTRNGDVYLNVAQKISVALKVLFLKHKLH